MRVTKKISLLLVAATVGLMGTAPAFAGMSEGRSVTFLGDPMFAISGAAGGMTAEKRAWVAQDNFDNALATASNKSPSAIQVCRENGAYTVRFDGRYLLTADAASASAAGMSALGLATSWADSMRAKLSDSDATQRYLATLRDDYKLKANVAVVESDIIRSGDDAIPFKLAEGSLSMDPEHPGQVLLVLDKAVVVAKDVVVPENAIMTGYLAKDSNGADYISFTTATIPQGDTIMLKGVIAQTSFSTEAPHLVCTNDMPANELTGVREPARIGIGAQEGRIAVIQQESRMVAATEQDVTY